MVQKASRYSYLVLAALFLIGILTQVFFVGLSLLGGRSSWNVHVGLGHGLGLFALLMVILAYTGRMARPVKPLTWLNFVIYILLADVVVFLRGEAPFVAALHPVLAVILFGVAGTLVNLARQTVRLFERSPSPAGVEPEVI